MNVFTNNARGAVYAVNAVNHRGPMFPVVMAGLLVLWALIAMAIACGPKLAASDGALKGMENPGVAYVSCEAASRAPGQLLRCTVDHRLAPVRDI